ncbi:MAG: TonB-dependent receptor [Proteobacteria bacterium]|nr:TonB-dependent receptor [Pseudomonadota bacterium]
MYRFIITLIVSFVFFSPKVLLCSEPHRLEDIVVTASRVETPVEETASSVSVISAKEIEEKNEPALIDVLRGLPGLDAVQTGGLGGTASVYIRGANPEHTLVLIDGMEANDVMHFGRLFDFADLTVDNIEQIEVVRGPQSTLYGSSAIGGVINIITKKGEGKPKFFISGEGGSFNTFRESTGISGSSKDFNYSLSLSHINSRGLSSANSKYGNIERDGYDNKSVSSRFGYTFNKHVDTDFSVRYTRTENDLDNGGGPGRDDVNNVGKSTQLLANGKVKIDLFDSRWLQSIEFGTNKNDRSYNNPTDFQHPTDSEQSSYQGRLDRFGWQHTVEVHKTNTLTFGAEYKEETGKSNYYWVSAWGPGFNNFPRETARNKGYYLQDQIKIGERFFGTAGIRIDDHSEIGSNTTYRIAPAYLIKELAMKLRGTYGTGVRAPSLYQLYAPATLWAPVGNTNLRAEESKGWDLGIDQAFLDEKISLGLTYFRNDFKNLIEYDNAQGYVNISKARSDGIEFSTKIKVIENLEAKFNYTYTDTENRTTGESLIRRPQNKFGVDMNYRFLDKGNINLRVFYVGKRRDYDPYPSSGIMGGYTVVNMAVQYELVKQIKLTGRIDNLLNRQYQEVWGYTSPGFACYGGVTVSF